jgi:hypothetical protein
MKVHLLKYLNDLPSNYVIIRKPSNFPQYQIGTDIDILCDDLQSIITYSKNCFKDLKVFYTLRPSNHYHIDILNSNNTLHLKLDFIDSLSVYKKTNIPNIIFNEILNTKTNVYGVYEPSFEYDLLLRYFEYKEFIQERPNKLKHLDYIKQYPNGINIVNNLLKKYNIHDKINNF